MEYSRDCTSTDQGSGLQCNREIETSVLSGRLETQLYTCGMTGNNGTHGEQGARGEGAASEERSDDRNALGM